MGSYFSTPAAPFRFLDLPAELQIIVYEQYLADSEPVDGCALAAGLLETCHSIRQDFLAIYKNHVESSRRDLRAKYESVANAINQQNIQENGDDTAKWDMLSAIDKALHFRANEKEWLATDKKLQLEIMRIRKLGGLEGPVYQEPLIAHVPRGTAWNELDVIRLAMMTAARMDTERAEEGDADRAVSGRGHSYYGNY